MSKVAVVYYSATGNTQAMAEAVAAGATAAGGEVSVMTADDFNVGVASEYDGIAFGCPAMGAEQLEEASFEPMFASVETSLAGKKVGLFGSYGWGDGEWMRSWQDRCLADGITLVQDGVMANEAPDGEALAACEALGQALV